MPTAHEGKPQRRALDFHSYDEVLADLDRLQAGAYDRCGKWSLGQNCEHLAMFMEHSMTGFEWKPPFFLRLIGPLVAGLFLRMRKIPEGRPAAREVSPAEVDDAAGVVHLRRAVEQIRNCNTFVPNPLLGRLTAPQWHELHWIHCSHHLSFLVPR